MPLRSLGLQLEYRSDRNDIVSEFFMPCLANAVSYDRCIEYVSLKSLVTLALGADAASDGLRMRIVTGSKMRASDIAAFMRMLSERPARRVERARSDKLAALESLMRRGLVEIKVAIPHSESVDYSFTERVGIFTDEYGDRVAFTGTSNRTFDSPDKDFESVDVFTSWRDAERVRTKVDNFERLWGNETRYLSVYGFADAARSNLIKYSASWATDFT